MEVILQQAGALLLGAVSPLASAMAAAAPAAKPSLGEQVVRLLIGSVPTALLFLVVVVAYEFLVHGPLTATLERRRILTEGAMEEAQRAIAQAEARAAEYAEKLRQARAEAYKIREQRIKLWNAEREAALEAARKSSGQRVSRAQAELDVEAAAARQAIQASAADLGSQALRAVLPLAAGGSR